MGIFEEAIISGRQILDYIPQRAPIVMVDSFFGMKDCVSKSGLTITDDNLFLDGEVMDECGIIEHIAQSAALRVGYACKESNRAVPVGFIGSVEKMTIHHLPILGATLSTEINIEQEVMNITLMSARVSADNQPIAECRMKIYLQV